jgi:hypothetical protein
MFSKKDAYLIQEYLTLKNGVDNEGDDVMLGTLFLEYQVTLYNNVQLKNATAVDQPKNQQFVVQCTKRITISNPNAASLVPSDDLAFNNYPVLINTTMDLQQSNVEKPNLRLLDYSPKTINTAVNVSGSSGGSTGQTTETSNSNTVGSTTAQTNSYGTSVSVGTMGDIPVTSATSSSEHSTTTTQEQSNTNGSSSGQNKSSESSSSESMSIKDWGTYGFVNPRNKIPYWTFGQEVPWNSIKCRKTNGTYYTGVNPRQIDITISDSMKAALYNGDCLYPPSELSVFGVNFVMKTSWLITINNTDSDEMVFSQAINLYAASHILNSEKNVIVYRDETPVNLSVIDGQSLSTTLSLNIMALDPLGNSEMAAIVGFIPSQFITKPASADSAESMPSKFKIISTTNELMVQDSTKYVAGSTCGFTASQTYLNATFSQVNSSLQITLYFKVVDVIKDYNLYLKHWTTTAEDVMLTLVINDDYANPITKYVDAIEGEGGANNLLGVSLRNQDYASIEYHDYLQLGLNSIQITMQPINANFSNCGYQIRAISIEDV